MRSISFHSGQAYVLFAVTALWHCGGQAFADGAERRPNIVFILADDTY